MPGFSGWLTAWQSSKPSRPSACGKGSSSWTKDLGASRPALAAAVEASKPDGALVVTSLARLAASLTEARSVAVQLASRNVSLQVGETVYPSGPMGVVGSLDLVLQFKADLIQLRTRRGLDLAKRRGRMTGKRPKLTEAQELEVVVLHEQGQMTSAEIAQQFGVARSTVYRALDRAAARAELRRAG